MPPKPIGRGSPGQKVCYPEGCWVWIHFLTQPGDWVWEPAIGPTFDEDAMDPDPDKSQTGKSTREELDDLKKKVDAILKGMQGGQIDLSPIYTEDMNERNRRLNEAEENRSKGPIKKDPTGDRENKDKDAEKGPPTKCKCGGNPNSKTGKDITLLDDNDQVIDQFPEKVVDKETGELVPNPKLEQYGIKMDGEGADCCSTKIQRDKKNCEEKANLLEERFDEDCDEEIKGFIKDSFMQACMRAKETIESVPPKNPIDTSKNPILKNILDCMSNPDLLLLVKNIKCTELPDPYMAQTDTWGDIRIDTQKIAEYASYNGIPYKEFLDVLMLHELTHLCCSSNSCNEADHVILGLYLNGLNSWNSPTVEEMQLYCDYTRETRIQDGVSNRYVSGNNFIIDLQTGDVYTKPVGYDYTTHSIVGGTPIMSLKNAPYPPCP